ncbi:DUF1552 domain-containing protein [Lentisphaera profundi]|uniref:DUF1552 domain-containing protein n=1 Tax=Lentisphaera profundi TaxID=1658616 RepID=A0ABY7VNE9_9BACT|nr:DUF1552 domain-containing protein [Lentisphaera profundi]WDE95643.1 DUF1552 domain-containing protein [Lentisphaera profundi]
MFKAISRRTVLRGVGASIALPMLEAMSAPRRSAGKVPKRLVFLGFPYGVTEETWFPKEMGAHYKMPAGLKPLEKYRKDFSVLSNLSNKYFPGSVHSGTTTWLTSANVYRDPTTQFKNSISCDQVAAEYSGRSTRFKSLELSTKGEGGLGPGLSLAWDAKGTPLAGERDPIEVFEKLFGNGGLSLLERRKQILEEKSILDSVYEDIRSINKKISKNDREKINEYLTSIRSMELDLKRAYVWAGKEKPKVNLQKPEAQLTGIAGIRSMYDLMVAAMQTDSTRVISYRQPLGAILNDLDIKNMPTHSMSHYKGFDARREASEARDKAQSELLAYLLGKMKSTKDVYGRSLLDHSLLAYGGGIRCVHDQMNTPLILAGRGGGGVKTGQHFAFKSRETPLANLWLSMLNHTAVPVESFGDSSGRLGEVFT